jgi:hypothetical protein
MGRTSPDTELGFERTLLVVQLQTGVPIHYTRGIDGLVDGDLLHRRRQILMEPMQVDRLTLLRPIAARQRG